MCSNKKRCVRPDQRKRKKKACSRCPCGVRYRTYESGPRASSLVLHPVPAVSAVPPLPPLPFPGGAIAHAWLWTVEGTDTLLGACRRVLADVAYYGSHAGGPPQLSCECELIHLNGTNQT